MVTMSQAQFTCAFQEMCPPLPPQLERKILYGVQSFRYKSFCCIMNSFHYHKVDSLQPTFHIKQFKTIQNELQTGNNELSQQNDFTTLQRIDFIMQQNDLQRNDHTPRKSGLLRLWCFGCIVLADFSPLPTENVAKNDDNGFCNNEGETPQNVLLLFFRGEIREPE